MNNCNPFNILGNGEELAALIDGRGYIFHSYGLRSISFNVQHDAIDVTSLGSEMLLIPTFSRTALSIEAECSGEIEIVTEMDLNEFLVRNKTIIELVKSVNAKLKEDKMRAKRR